MNALYYPSIHFQNSNWLKGMALYYDRIYRIVPPAFELKDNDDIRVLCESGHIGLKVDPLQYSKAASSKFIEKLETWNAAGLHATEDEVSEFANIHTTKMDQRVKSMFLELGYEKKEEWMSVPHELATNFMLFLANEIGSRNKLSLLTDDFAPWTGTTYFSQDGHFDDYASKPLEEVRKSGGDTYLFGLVLQGLVPLNISEIPPKKILEFREKRR